jgi:penicillin-binding protein 1A
MSGQVVKRILFGTLATVLAAVVVFLAYTLVLILQISKNQSLVSGISLPMTSQNTRVYASDYDPEKHTGTLLGALYVENRDYTKLSDIPKQLVDCILASEDAGFWRHKGFNVRSIIRAALANLRSQSLKEGASTISQQLARNVFLPNIKSQKTISRKLQEIILARAIENKYSKQEILESYLNFIYFGNRAYGVKAAAYSYFNKDLDKLTLAECATLAGLPKAPTFLNPFKNKDGAIERRDEVLDRLEEEKHRGNLDLSYIPEGEIEKAKEEKLVLSHRRAGSSGWFAPYFVSYVRQYLYDKYGEDQVLRHGLTVVTTLNPKDQAIAEDAVVKEVTKVKKAKRVSQGALVSVDVKTGGILAMVGGLDYDASNFNRATMARRQPGSSFKPFVYSTALEDGWSITDTLQDKEIGYPDGQGGEWVPHNYDRKYLGAIPLWYAIVESKNAATVDLLNHVGPHRVVEMARRMGLTTQLNPFLSLGLGSDGVIPLEMAAAFATFPRGGVHVKPICVLQVYDHSGTLVEDNTRSVQSRSNVAMSPETAYTMVVLMEGVIQRGTGTRANIGRPAGGKTGTTNDYRDAWFVGYTPDVCTAVWVGNDDFKPMNRMFGGGTPAQIWKDFMSAALKETKATDFIAPDDAPVKSLPGFAPKPPEKKPPEETQPPSVPAEPPEGKVYF